VGVKKRREEKHEEEKKKILLIRGWCCARSRFALGGAPRGIVVANVADTSTTCFSNYLASAVPHYPLALCFLSFLGF